MWMQPFEAQQSANARPPLLRHPPPLTLPPPPPLQSDRPQRAWQGLSHMHITPRPRTLLCTPKTMKLGKKISAATVGAHVPWQGNSSASPHRSSPCASQGSLHRSYTAVTQPSPGGSHLINPETQIAERAGQTLRVVPGQLRVAERV